MGAVRQSVLGLYPDGPAVRTNAMPLTQLSPALDFTLVAQASRAWARSISDGRPARCIRPYPHVPQPCAAGCAGAARLTGQMG